jgi:hypothetical protein
VRYFNQSLDSLTGLSLRGIVSGIEFYPGLFGREEGWCDWKLPSVLHIPKGAAVKPPLAQPE